MKYKYAVVTVSPKKKKTCKNKSVLCLCRGKTTVLLQKGLVKSRGATWWNRCVLTESVSGDGRQRQRVVSHRLILDYLQINKTNLRVYINRGFKLVWIDTFPNHWRLYSKSVHLYCQEKSHLCDFTQENSINALGSLWGINVRALRHFKWCNLGVNLKVS